MSNRSCRRGLLGTTVAVAAMAFTGVASADAHPAAHLQHRHGPGQSVHGHHGQPWHPSGPPSKASLSPQVVHTGTGPTGYEVTFRYYDPTATSVQLRGEWYFSSPSGTTTTTSQGLLPSQ